MNDSQEVNKPIKASIGYTVGNILVKGISFLTLPIFSRILTIEEFGIYNVFLSYDAVLSVVIGFALHSSVRSAHYEFENETDEYTSSISLIYIVNALVLLLCAFLFGSKLKYVLGIEQNAILLLIPYSFGSALVSLFNERVSLSYDYKRYLTIAILNSVGNILLSLFFILSIFRNQKEMGRILAATLTIFILGVYICFCFFKKERPRYLKKYWLFGLKYCLPIVPHGVSQVLLGQFDRIMINTMIGNGAAGVYSLASNIKLILIIVTNSLASVWLTWFYKEMNVYNVNKIQEYAKILVVMFSVLSIGLMAMSPELIFVLGGNEYDIGKYVAIPMIVDSFILFVYAIVVPVEYYKKKTIYVLAGTIIAAVVNVILNWIFIRQYGFIAAAYTTLFAYMIYLIIHIIVSYKLIKEFVIPIKVLLFLVVIIIAMAAFDLFFIDEVLARYFVCFVVVMIMGSYLVKKYFGVSNIEVQ